MIQQQQLRQLLPEGKGDAYAALALLGGSVAALGLWKWLGKKRIQKKMEEARRTREEGMKKMAKAVQQFREQVNHPPRGLSPTGVSADAVLQTLLPAHGPVALSGADVPAALSKGKGCLGRKGGHCPPQAG